MTAPDAPPLVVLAYTYHDDPVVLGEYVRTRGPLVVYRDPDDGRERIVPRAMAEVIEARR